MLFDLYNVFILKTIGKIRIRIEFKLAWILFCSRTSKSLSVGEFDISLNALLLFLYITSKSLNAFHDLGVKYGQRTKIVQKWAKTTLRAKWSFHPKNGRSSFLNPWWILSMKDQTLKFLWFRDNFEGVWDENMQGHFLDRFERSWFFAVLTSEGYFENYEKFVRFLKKAFSGKIVVDFQSFKKTSRLPKTDFVWLSKRSKQVAVQKSYFD